MAVIGQMRNRKLIKTAAYFFHFSFLVGALLDAVLQMPHLRQSAGSNRGRQRRGENISACE